MRDLSIWVELTRKRRKCHNCGKDIDQGSMMVRIGEKGLSLKTTNICANCFETMMNKLTDDFHTLGEDELGAGVPRAEGSHCFSCGNGPERCNCGKEAYR